MTTPIPVKAFADSNVLLYLLSNDARKADRAEALLQSRPTISVQVLNELTSVMRRKLGMPWTEVDEFVATVQALCIIEPLTVEAHDAARRIAREHRLGFYDAMIVASALLAGCDTLWSEDMHDGLRIDRELRIRNSFA